MGGILAKRPSHVSFGSNRSKASHAALVARGMGRPAVTGAASVEIDADAGEVRIGDRVLRTGEQIAIDGTLGTITADDVPLVEPQVSPEFQTVLAWCDDLRRLGNGIHVLNDAVARIDIDDVLRKFLRLRSQSATSMGPSSVERIIACNPPERTHDTPGGQKWALYKILWLW